MRAREHLAAADREAGGGQGVFAQCRKVNPRGIREEHDCERRLGDQADGFALDRRIEPAESLVAHEDAAGDEHHCGTDHGSGEPPRNGRVRKDEERNRNEARAAHSERR
jgi:hypothetical protein